MQPRKSNQASRQRTFIDRGESLVLDNAQGTVVEVERGCIWLTLENDTRDVVLVPGMRFEIDRSGRTVIVAEEASEMRLVKRLSDRIPAALRLVRKLGRTYARWSESWARRALRYF